MTRILLLAATLLAIGLAPTRGRVAGVRIGSKQFTESVILGEMLAQLVRDAGEQATHVAELGGTTLVYDALRRGEIDAYPEYTGTLREEIFAGQDASTAEKLQALLRADGIVATAGLGFSNSYALATPRATAERLGLRTIGDLARHPELRLGLSIEFIDREDGWKNLRKAYALPHDATGIDHDLAYSQLAAGQLDVTDVYTTEGLWAKLDLVVLEDDRGYFPDYEAVVLSRADLETRRPDAAAAIRRLAGAIDVEQMIRMNAEVDARSASEAQAAASFLERQFDIAATVAEVSVPRQVWRRTCEHLDLVRRSLLPAIVVATPLGVLAAKRGALGHVLLGIVGVVQTIPALALLVLLMAPVAYLDLGTLGAGSATAILALFLYSLLPIVQNTAAGMAGIAPEYRESAHALGLSSWFRLAHVELPLATRAILAGVKTAAVLNVGFATLGALVGAGGFGQPILTGIRLRDTGLILQGALPAAGLAIVIQLAFAAAERWLVPAGLQVRPARRRR